MNKTEKYNILFTPIAAALTALLFSTAANATPTVNGNVISWTDDGWHQVQDQATYESICEGGSECTVPTGAYVVINHTTGERFANIPVVVQTPPDVNPEPVPATVPAPVLASGQIVSYRTGDDGAYQSGAVIDGARFRDNGNGTFTDTLTGITWLGIVDCIVQSDWSGAVDYANLLSANSALCPALADGSEAGNWRLPNVNELHSLVDMSKDTAMRDSRIPFNGNWGFYPSAFWSSSSFHTDSENSGWMVDANFGQIVITDKDVTQHVWPVRVDD